MLVFSACPRCQQQVTIPSGVEASMLVRCPLCNAEYPLSEALPPALIPVGAVANASLVWSSGSAVEPIVEIEGESPADDQATEDNITVSLPLAGESAEHGEPHEISFEDHAAEGIIVGGEEEEENEASAVASQAAPSRRRRRAPKSGLQTLIEVVTGGVAGCLVAYYGLAIYFRADFKNVGLPQLPLPGIAWLTTAEKTNGNGEKPNIEKPVVPPPKTTEAPAQPPAQPEVAQPPQQAAAPQPAQPAAVAPQPVAVAPQPPAKPLRPKLGSADYLGPRMAPAVTSDQLGTELKSVSTLVADAKAGEAVPANAYETICRLAAAVTFVNGDASDTKLVDRIAAAGSLLEKVATHKEWFEEFGRLADKQIETKSDKPAGILLSGTVTAIGKQQRLSGVVVRLAGQSKTVSVLLDQEIAAKVNDQVLVLGVLVHNPGSSLVGYRGTKPVVVWASTLVKAS